MAGSSLNSLTDVFTFQCWDAWKWWRGHLACNSRHPVGVAKEERKRSFATHAWLFPPTGAIFPRMNICRLCFAVFVALEFVQLVAESSSPRRYQCSFACARPVAAQLACLRRVLANGKTPCFKVMLARPIPETERKIPHEIEGYPVATEIFDETRSPHP
jgi:hypothetical protein